MSDRVDFVLWCAPNPTALKHPLLTTEERRRAARFRRTIDAQRHLTGRVLARRAAAHVLDLAPADIEIDVEPAGRPILCRAGHLLPAHLSITHAGNLVGIAISDVPVGLDVEVTADVAAVWDTAPVWTAAERAWLTALPPAERGATAAQWWTAKEAVLKASGMGFLEPPEQLSITESPLPWLPLNVAPGHHAAITGTTTPPARHLRTVGDPIPS